MDAKSPVEEAIAVITQALLKHDGNALKQRMSPPEQAPVEPDGDEACPECEAGTCDNPEHMGDEDAAGLLASLGGE